MSHRGRNGLGYWKEQQILLAYKHGMLRKHICDRWNISSKTIDLIKCRYNVPNRINAKRPPNPSIMRGMKSRVSHV